MSRPDFNCPVCGTRWILQNDKLHVMEMQNHYWWHKLEQLKEENDRLTP